MSSFIFWFMIYFPNNFFYLVPVGNLVTLGKPVVALIVIKTIVDKSLKLSGLVFIVCRSHVPNLIELFDFRTLEICQVFVTDRLTSIDTA